MFDRTANLANNQIINYRCDPTEKWLVLIGIAPGAPEVINPSLPSYLLPCTVPLPLTLGPTFVLVGPTTFLSMGQV